MVTSIRKSVWSSHSQKFILSHININSFKDKLEILKPISTEMLHIGMIAENKLGIFVSAGTVLN